MNIALVIHIAFAIRDVNPQAAFQPLPKALHFMPLPMISVMPRVAGRGQLDCSGIRAWLFLPPEPRPDAVAVAFYIGTPARAPQRWSHRSLRDARTGMLTRRPTARPACPAAFF